MAKAEREMEKLKERIVDNETVLKETEEKREKVPNTSLA